MCLLHSVTCSPLALHVSTARDTNPTLSPLSVSDCSSIGTNHSRSSPRATKHSIARQKSDGQGIIRRATALLRQTADSKTNTNVFAWRGAARRGAARRAVLALCSTVAAPAVRRSSFASNILWADNFISAAFPNSIEWLQLATDPPQIKVFASFTTLF
jgi:hypothetical protein